MSKKTCFFCPLLKSNYGSKIWFHTEERQLPCVGASAFESEWNHAPRMIIIECCDPRSLSMSTKKGFTLVNRTH